MAQKLVDLALSVVGYTAPSDNYGNLICLNEHDNRHDMMLMSGCGLVACGLLKRGGCDDPILNNPYIIGRAVSNVLDIGQRCKAIRTLWHGDELSPGCVVIVNNPIHVFTVVAVSGLRVTSVDGGQRTANGLETVLRRERTLVHGALDGRPILHVIDGNAVLDYWAREAEREVYPMPDTARSRGG